MPVQPTLLPETPESTAARSSRRANRAATRSHRIPASTYRAPSVVQLKPGPLHKLAWIFGVR